MIGAECNGYVFGAYDSLASACLARERCANYDLLWQQQEPGPCLVQRFDVGLDDDMEELVCGDEAGVDLNKPTASWDKPA